MFPMFAFMRGGTRASREGKDGKAVHIGEIEGHGAEGGKSIPTCIQQSDLQSIPPEGKRAAFTLTFQPFPRIRAGGVPRFAGA
jgi:hypothetical protein